MSRMIQPVPGQYVRADAITAVSIQPGTGEQEGRFILGIVWSAPPSLNPVLMAAFDNEAEAQGAASRILTLIDPPRQTSAARPQAQPV